MGYGEVGDAGAMQGKAASVECKKQLQVGIEGGTGFTLALA